MSKYYIEIALGESNSFGLPFGIYGGVPSNAAYILVKSQGNHPYTVKCLFNLPKLGRVSARMDPIASDAVLVLDDSLKFNELEFTTLVNPTPITKRFIDFVIDKET